MDIWAGDIVLDVTNPSSKVEGATPHVQIDHDLTYIDVRFRSPLDPSQFCIGHGVSLHFLSCVDPARIPLYLSAGPSLEVYTGKEATEDWLSSIFLDAFSLTDKASVDADHPEAQRRSQYPQSDVGILMKVEGECKAYHTGPRITEFLIYATISQDFRAKPRLPTPPRSSSPDSCGIVPLNGTTCHGMVYALPLSSELCYHASQYHGPLSPTSEDIDHKHPQFLGLPWNHPTSEHKSPRKRQRMNSLFENATRLRKRIKGRGGKGFAEVMAGVERSAQQNMVPFNVLGPESGKSTSVSAHQTTKQQAIPRTFGLSRAHSIGSLRDLEEARPPSRSGGVSGIKRSALHRITSTTTLDGSSLAPEPFTGIEQQNKSMLTRVILTGMRLYGLQSKKRPISSPAISESDARPVSSHAVGEDDEYKLVYHQTFKAASFTFRRHISSMIVRQDVMREAVDRLLAIFCADPLDVLRVGEHAYQELGVRDDSQPQHSFDPPSGKGTTKAVMDKHCSTPNIRKLHQNREGRVGGSVRNSVSPSPIIKAPEDLHGG
ncbi:hypothetical protein MMC24_007051 [Lignoscripta atroalba]|nr:hypothetical protein [Lignoscripta atroalba]